MHDYQKGDHVCVAGRGVDLPVHWHGKVERVTKLYVVLENGGKRYRKDTGRSVPYSPYGGSSIEPQCQRKRVS